MSLLKRVRIGNVTTVNNVFVAPLARISGQSFRIMSRRFGAGLVFTEMVSAFGLVNADPKARDLLRFTREERPAGIQIFGPDPHVMAAAASLCGLYPADLIDINAGCSVGKVLETGAGAGLLDDPEGFYRIVAACVRASRHPVSVKLRLGLSEDRIAVLETARAAEEAGASLITLHPRTASQGYRGRARWEYIGLVKEQAGVPVCGNGDIRQPEDAVRMIEQTGCDAVMIGRTAVGNPWVVRETIRFLQAHPGSPGVRRPSSGERIECALEHLQMLVALKGDGRGVMEAKRHLYSYLKGIPRVSGVRRGIAAARTAAQVKEKLESLLPEEREE